MALITATLLVPPTPEAPHAVVRLRTHSDAERVVLHDLVVQGGVVDHVDRVVLDPHGDVEVELSAPVPWSFSGADSVQVWELSVQGLPIAEPAVTELPRVAIPLEVSAPWPTRPWWPLLLVPVVGALLLGARRAQ